MFQSFVFFNARNYKVELLLGVICFATHSLFVLQLVVTQKHCNFIIAWQRLQASLQFR